MAGCKLIQHMDDPPKPGKPNDAGVRITRKPEPPHEVTWQHAGTTLPLAESHWNMFDFASDGRVESTSPA